MDATAPAPLKFSLNMDRDYAPDWGIAEGVREFLANTIDESGTIDTSDPDVLIFRTTTAPSLSELTVIGKSSKRGDNSKIGQFGEGAKVGANALLRAGAYARIDTPSGRVTFIHETPPGFDTSILHALLDRSICEPGCTVTITFKGISRYVPSIYISDPQGPIAKPAPSPLSLYVNGIAVKAPIIDSLFNWNTNLKLNRDRATIDPWSLRSFIANWFCKVENYTDAFFFDCLKHSDTIEAESLRAQLSYMGYSIKDKIRGGLVALYGAKTVLSSGKPDIDVLAQARGYTVLSIHTDMIRALHLLDDKLFPTADDVIRRHETFLPSAAAPSSMLAELTRLLDLLDTPATIQVFDPKPSEPALLGYCDTTTQTIWLCSTLFGPGSRRKRLGVFCHELAHLNGSEDLSKDFEDQLTTLCGSLAALSLPPTREK